MAKEVKRQTGQKKSGQEKMAKKTSSQKKTGQSKSGQGKSEQRQANARQSSKRKAASSKDSTSKDSSPKKNASNSARSSGPSKSKSKQNGTHKEPKNSLRGELLFLGVLVFCIILQLSAFGTCGILGRGLSYVLFGLFGLLGYIMPVLFLGALIAGYANRENQEVKRLIICSGFLVVVLCSIWELLLAGYTKNTGFFEYFQNAAKTHSAGGLVGGWQIYLLGHLMGAVGTWVVILAELIVILIFMTRKHLFAFLGRKSQGLWSEISEHRQERARKKEFERNYPDFEMEEELEGFSEAADLTNNEDNVDDSANMELPPDDSSLREKQKNPGTKESFFEDLTSDLMKQRKTKEKLERATPHKKNAQEQEESGEQMKKDNQEQDWFGPDMVKKPAAEEMRWKQQRMEQLRKLPIYEQELTQKFHFDEEIVISKEDRYQPMIPDSLNLDLDKMLAEDRERRGIAADTRNPYKDQVVTEVLVRRRSAGEVEKEVEMQDGVSAQGVFSSPVSNSPNGTDISRQAAATAENGQQGTDLNVAVLHNAANGNQPGMNLFGSGIQNQQKSAGGEEYQVQESESRDNGSDNDGMQTLTGQNTYRDSETQVQRGAYVQSQTALASEEDLSEKSAGQNQSQSGDHCKMKNEDMPANDDIAGKVEANQGTPLNLAPVKPELEGVKSMELTEKGSASTLSEKPKQHVFPPLDLLQKPNLPDETDTQGELATTAQRLQMTLDSFKVDARVTNASRGPQVTRFEVQPEPGVKVSKITGLADDIKLNLAAQSIRIEAPIPGKAAVGIEVPNKVVATVSLREILDTPVFQNAGSNVAFAVGKGISGNTIVTDIAKMPHLLIAGSTGAGKSVCINTLIMSILYKASPEDVRMIMVDPKVVELSVYNGIPHLLVPVVTDANKALGALNWAVAQMEDRYSKFKDLSVRDLKGYNEKIKTVEEYGDERYVKLPQIVIILDELADLMMVTKGEVETPIVRLSQKARAAGIHLVIATQRPSVDVITGLIKANVPSRIAFLVSSQIDSRTILDSAGAETLLGKGDMLFAPVGSSKPARVQGAFVSDDEVNSVVDFLKEQYGQQQYDDSVEEHMVASASKSKKDESGPDLEGDDRDEYFTEAAWLVVKKQKASIGILQRAFRIGYNRAARLMDQLCEAGVVGEEQGTKPRDLLVDEIALEQLLDNL